MNLSIGIYTGIVSLSWYWFNSQKINVKLSIASMFLICNMNKLLFLKSQGKHPFDTESFSYCALCSWGKTNTCENIWFAYLNNWLHSLKDKDRQETMPFSFILCFFVSNYICHCWCVKGTRHTKWNWPHYKELMINISMIMKINN